MPAVYDRSLGGKCADPKSSWLVVDSGEPSKNGIVEYSLCDGHDDKAGLDSKVIVSSKSKII